MREALRQLHPYRPPEAQGRALNRNTNRLGPHPATRRLAELAWKIDLSEYPDARATPVRRALAARYGLEPEWFTIGNGSNEVIDLVLKALLNPGDVVAVPSPSYAMYRHYALANATTVVEVPLNETFDLDAHAFLETDAALVVLCTPNNPTGNALSREALEALLGADPKRPVVIDEAYAEFGNQDWLARVREFPNLLVARTLSKAYGLAGLRVGYLAAHPRWSRMIERAWLPYNVNALSQALAQAALSDREFVSDTVTLVSEERPRWSAALAERGFRVWPSQANFLLAQVPQGVDRDALVQQLADAGVELRVPDAHPRLWASVRVTVGPPEDREALLEALDEVLP